MTFELAIVLGATLAWIALEGALSPAEPHARLPREVATGLALLAVHVTGAVEHVAREGAASGLVVASGCAMLAAGIGLRIAAIRALGPRFVSATTALGDPVSTGPYRWLRHPSEVGLLAAAAGTAVALESLVAAAITALVLAPLSVARCADEDRALERAAPGRSRRRPSRGATLSA